MTRRQTDPVSSLGGFTQRADDLARLRRGALAAVTGAASLAAAIVADTAAARADLKLCNSTAGRVGVAIGYRDDKGWATEGWWNIASRSCETLLKGALPSRFIYVYAVDYDRGGEWAGSNNLCTSEKSFWIRETTDCKSRGQQNHGFYEVDTGSSKDWTIRLSDPDTRK